ncbi:GFA family protein [Consotaella aegiceratis]|uniref:GFA family protein n=1 Tax=Consotaella aegiceratis TaxID=3097961 RepID=UPI002F41239D
MLEGGCFCGAVRYRIDGEVLESAICHCHSCRKTASAPNLPFVTVDQTAFSVVRGEPREYRSSPPVTRTFCGTCGSPLAYRHDSEPKTLDVTVVSLDEPEATPPTLPPLDQRKTVVGGDRR